MSARIRSRSGGSGPGNGAGRRAGPARRPAPLLSPSTARALALLALSVAAWTVLVAVARVPMADMLVYRAEGAAVLNGDDLYALRVTEWNLPATYPPFAAMLFTPTAVVPVPVLKVLVTAGNLVLLGVLAHLSFRCADWPSPPRRPAAVLLVAAFGLWLEPVFQTFWFGQVNLLVAALVLWDLSRPDTARGKGIAIGVAAGVKLTPGIFAVYLLLSGRVRAAAVAAGAFAATVLAGAAFLPGETVEFFTLRMFETERVGELWIVDNQSLQGLMARVLHTREPGALWAAAAVAVAAFGLAVAARTATAGPALPRAEAWGAVACAVTALLVSPISWSHHWVWCVPLLVLLAAEAGGSRRRQAAVAAVAALFTCRSLWLVPKDGDADLHLAWWLQPFASPYPLLGLALLVLLAARLRRLRRDAGERPSAEQPAGR
ncbi:glycosyltransferase 87 family protein [Streptomyces thermolineatus]|uniref:glycosyltransferase 87 family protein n=1 Tax=Streptomyces thermolineatus TaxID=44033 RepID=UPI00384BC189